MSDLEAAAREILADTVPKELRPDPITGLLSDISEPLESASPTKNIAGIMGSLTLQPKAGAAVSTTSPSSPESSQYRRTKTKVRPSGNPPTNHRHQ